MLGCAIGLGQAAQAPAQTPAGEGEAAKSFEVPRVDGEPVVDGVLDEELWSRAVLIDDLHQINPIEYAAPSQLSEIRLYYDDDALYVAARLWDSESDRITAQVLRQGEGLGNEDQFAIIIDPYLDRRSGYRFQVNPNGVRWDALYQNTTNLESNWEGIWRAAATQDEQGWNAEMAIPFKTLSFNPNTTEWGINFERSIQRNDETLGWVSRNRELNPGVAGTATGLAGLEQGRGLDIVPSVTARGERFFGGSSRSDSNLEPSLDIFYKFTPSLNGALTLNTDFSATEVDDRQVNLTRFNLFFPEKRDFFLQDADIFEFGRIGTGGFNRPGSGQGSRESGNPAIPRAAAQNGRPFFSRTLGLSRAGRPVDIEYGGKLSGRAGRWNVGALAIRQDEFEAVDATDIFVGRLTANVLNESTVGVVVTDGDPHSNLDSTLLGTDFRYRNSRLPGGGLLESELWYQQTDTEGVTAKDRAFGYGISVPNAVGWRGTLSSRHIEENFDPAVGFVNRTGIRDYALDFGYRMQINGPVLRSWYVGYDGYLVERLDTGAVESGVDSLRLSFNNNTRDAAFSRLIATREVLLEEFVIHAAPDGSKRVVIPPGDYTFNEFLLGVQTGNQRRFAGRVNVRRGDFYTGKRTSAGLNVAWRPSRHFTLQAGYTVNNIDLPEGEFTVRLSQLRAEIVFSSTLSWVNLMQYDNVAESVGFNSRLHWIPEAGREGFIVINHNLSDFDRNDSFHSTSADISIKFNHTWRF
ncbi:carbohydrate binding family 9 domain-containing protein [Candidatus Rariloculus sp.]|uniref:carbohydrate binding family 9 domain-containing protein n=1 Tax=Candidatus Rariloculus sp. TaxID=3101265 RepID=UPI003D0E05F3